ncbi:MAG: hypothetical protein JWN96_1617 [Mycobacterium sp.]|nr:hypothetical protein [Mycobacterium sp.]
MPGAPKIDEPGAEAGPGHRPVTDYPTPHRSPADLLNPVRTGIRLAGPGGAKRLRQAWEQAGTTPPRLRSLRLLTGAATDEMAMGFARLFGMANAGEQLPRIEAEMLDAIALYRRKGWLDNPAAFHAAPQPAAPKTITKEAMGCHWEILEWQSGYLPDPQDPGAERWAGYARNCHAIARVLRHSEPRPWLVLLHGAFMGYLTTDARMFDAARLHEELGVNVVLPVLPLHGPRRPEGGLLPRSLPTIDALDNVHGLAQSAADVRALLGWIRTQDEQPIGLYGVSLGSYVAALVGALEEPLACLIAGIPAVDFPTVFRSQTPPRIRRTDWFERFMDEMTELHTVVSPGLGVPRTPVERRFIYAGRGDRILRPLQQAAELWRLWQEPEIYWFDGGHVAHVRSPDIRLFTDKALSASGMTAS